MAGVLSIFSSMESPHHSLMFFKDSNQHTGAYQSPGPDQTVVSVVFQGSVKVKRTVPGKTLSARNPYPEQRRRRCGCHQSGRHAERTFESGRPRIYSDVYATGDGQLGGDALDGRPAVAVTTTDPVIVAIGGQYADVLYAGRVPGLLASCEAISACVGGITNVGRRR